MKKLVLLMALVFALTTAAEAAVVIEVNDVGDGSGVVEINFASDANVSAFGLDITVDVGAINDISDYFVGECDVSNKGYGIFPASFDRVINPADPNYNHPSYTPVADACDPGAQPGLGSKSITIEMGALYESGNNPPKQNGLCKVKVTESCCMSITGNSTRGNVVLEGGTSASLDVASKATNVPIHVYPQCWNSLSQCHADTDGDLNVGVFDFYEFRDAWNKSHPDAAYKAHPCADIDKDGTVGVFDFYEFRDNWNKSVLADCTQIGDPCSVFQHSCP